MQVVHTNEAHNKQSFFQRSSMEEFLEDFKQILSLDPKYLDDVLLKLYCSRGS